MVLIKSTCTSGTSMSRSIFWCNKIKVAGKFFRLPEVGRTLVVAGGDREREVGEDFVERVLVCVCLCVEMK